MVRGWSFSLAGLTMAREDSVKCLRCLLYALNLLFWVSQIVLLHPNQQVGTAGPGFLQPAETVPKGMAKHYLITWNHTLSFSQK